MHSHNLLQGWISLILLEFFTKAKSRKRLRKQINELKRLVLQVFGDSSDIFVKVCGLETRIQ